MLATIVDPLNKFPHINPDDIVRSLGLIHGWAIHADDYSGFKECLLDHYGQFYGGPLRGGIVNEEGYYVYPEDPDLVPLAGWEHDGETLYQYQYGIVAVISADGSQWITRMD